MFKYDGISSKYTSPIDPMGIEIYRYPLTSSVWFGVWIAFHFVGP